MSFHISIQRMSLSFRHYLLPMHMHMAMFVWFSLLCTCTPCLEKMGPIVLWALILQVQIYCYNFFKRNIMKVIWNYCHNKSLPCLISVATLPCKLDIDLMLPWSCWKEKRRQIRRIKSSWLQCVGHTAIKGVQNIHDWSWRPQAPHKNWVG